MTEREQQIVRLALLFALANRGDIIAAFCKEDDDNVLSVNGIEMTVPTEEEISACLKLC